MRERSTRAQFYGHRIYPRFTGLIRVTSQVPGLTETVLALGSGLLQDLTPSSSENPTADQIRSTLLVVCGVQRSGTTFLAQAAEAAADGAGIIWHTHDPFVPRDFLPHDVPVIIPLRDPLACAISKATYHNDPVSPQALCRRMDLVTAWCRLIAHEPRNPLISVVEFDEFTADPDTALAPLLRFRTFETVGASTAITRVASRDTERDTPCYHTHLPHPDRLERRARFEAFTDHASIRRHLDMALDAQERVRQNHGA